jgi:hypothetical protein
VFLSTLRHILFYVIGLIWPSKGRCRRVTRDDLAFRGKRSLHICSSWESAVSPRYAHVNSMAPDAAPCPYSLPSTFFTGHSDVPLVYRTKPHYLDFTKEYLKMDVWTLGAYLFHWHGRFQTKDLISQPRLEMSEINSGVLVAHVIAEPPTLPISCWPAISGLSCDDVDGLLKGYPPYYRMRLRTPSGHLVEHPIHSAEDVFRGGWIAAIGLCKPIILGKHRMRDPGLTPKEKLPHLLHVVRPFARILEAFHNFDRAFPDKNIKDVVKMAKEIRTHKRSNTSRSETWFWASDVIQKFPADEIHSQAYLKELTARQIQTALGAFNHFGPLSTTEIKLLGPVLDEVFVAVLVGMHKAAEWDEKCSRRDYLNVKELNFEEYKRVVYVRESYGEE